MGRRVRLRRSKGNGRGRRRLRRRMRKRISRFQGEESCEGGREGYEVGDFICHALNSALSDLDFLVRALSNLAS